MKPVLKRRIRGGPGSPSLPARMFSFGMNVETEGGESRLFHSPSPPQANRLECWTRYCLNIWVMLTKDDTVDLPPDYAWTVLIIRDLFIGQKRPK